MIRNRSRWLAVLEPTLPEGGTCCTSFRETQAYKTTPGYRRWKSKVSVLRPALFFYFDTDSAELYSIHRLPAEHRHMFA